MRIPCPHCGLRDLREFTIAGADAGPRPGPESSLEAWDGWLHLRDNPAGPADELWQHLYGCGAWLRIRRDTTSHALLSVRLAAEPVAAATEAAGEQAPARRSKAAQAHPGGEAAHPLNASEAPADDDPREGETAAKPAEISAGAARSEPVSASAGQAGTGDPARPESVEAAPKPAGASGRTAGGKAAPAPEGQAAQKAAIKAAPKPEGKAAAKAKGKAGKKDDPR